MYAIVATGGKQVRVQAGQILRLETLDAHVGDTVAFDQILAVGGEGIEPAIGAPFVSGATVVGVVVEHGRERKVIIFKKVRRSQYKRRNGHRQNYTAVRFEEISFGKHSVKAEPMKEKAAPAEAKAAKAAKAPKAHKAAVKAAPKSAKTKAAAKKTAGKKAK